MIVYRVANLKYKDSTLTGIGAEKVGGRWNQVGTRAVYCSENISLALLEYYVHSENIANLPSKILIAKIEFPDDFKIEELAELPKQWNQYPYSSKTTSIFTSLTKDRNIFALRVPSTIIGLEYNIILNPLYKEFGKVEIVNFIELPIDERLKKVERD
ncbi:MAG: RES family NAD+ phosphorylase [Bacteroidetes bacterium]|nr:RES family NAD+ phosphorylase [Bacteroidota bacterium]MBU1485575.1 RES family NAD+ phosphorylase [Bacteroidota bacterium]MBU2045772.1 RES family NAD+ phosphorylase [Bacteroidota bacterium]MBU2268535.1 RES family NAD+ phosphorylase [Bacteroidota bacterium]MBU2376931.1 RES family NAD+ phosphorylase [Bacteroidota bacterium]